MSFNWVEYFQLARYLSGASPDAPTSEASLRCAISRAYYAAFCAARESLIKKGYHFTKTGEDHALVRKQFAAARDRQTRRIANNLFKLYNERGRADYDNEMAALPQTWEKVEFYADEVLRLL